MNIFYNGDLLLVKVHNKLMTELNNTLLVEMFLINQVHPIYLYDVNFIHVLAHRGALKVKLLDKTMLTYYDSDIIKVNVFDQLWN